MDFIDFILALHSHKKQPDFQPQFSDFRASAKNKDTIWLVLWSVYCVASTSTYPLICTGGCALPGLIKTGEPKYSAIWRIYFFPRP